MRKNIVLFAILLIGSLTLTGCSSIEQTTDETNNTSPSVTASASAYDKITAEDAKKMMDESKDVILLDVRTEEEYKESHIEGAILIPDYEVADKALEQLKDKDATILVYCRSGRRSALAAQALYDLGYTSIYDFGGIIDWPYDVVTE